MPKVSPIVNGEKCCGVCHQWRSLTDFHYKSRALQRWTYKCRDCKQHYDEGYNKKRRFLKLNSRDAVYREAGIILGLDRLHAFLEDHLGVQAVAAALNNTNV